MYLSRLKVTWKCPTCASKTPRHNDDYSPANGLPPPMKDSCATSELKGSYSEIHVLWGYPMSDQDHFKIVDRTGGASVTDISFLRQHLLQFQDVFESLKNNMRDL